MLSANSAMSLVLASSIATPRNCSPAGPYCFCKSTNQGISILHGPHQVAQKLRTTGLPRKSDKWTVSPSRDCKVKSGAMPLSNTYWSAWPATWRRHRRTRRRRSARRGRRARAPGAASRSRCRGSGSPSAKMAGSHRGAPSAYTEAGPPERISATGFRRCDLLDARPVGDKLGVDARLADAASDQLRVLAAEVEHEDRPLLGDAARRAGRATPQPRR